METKMNREAFKAELATLVKLLIPTISDDYRIYGDEDDRPGIQITIGADENGWLYQTGDNSYVGGAYSFRNWGVGGIYRDSDPADVAEWLISDLEASAQEDTKFFFDEQDDEA